MKRLNRRPTHIEAGLCSCPEGTPFGSALAAVVTKAVRFSFHTFSVMSESCLSVLSLPEQRQRPSAPVNKRGACVTYSVDVPVGPIEFDDLQVDILKNRLEYKKKEVLSIGSNTCLICAFYFFNN